MAGELFVVFAITVGSETQRHTRPVSAKTTYADAYRMATIEAARVGGTIRMRESGLPDVAVLTFAAVPTDPAEPTYWEADVPEPVDSQAMLFDVAEEAGDQPS